MDRILIRKLIWNIFSESKYINTMMELADRKNPDSAIALSQEETKEIVILLSQADYLHDYLKEHGVLSVKDEINNRSVKEIVQLLANNLIPEETGYDLISNLLNANNIKLNTGTEEKTVERNEPLTWNELKDMIGKPIWVERTEKYCVPHWAIIENVIEWDSIPYGTLLLQPDDEELYISDHAKTWRAYRKERND